MTCGWASPATDGRAPSYPVDDVAMMSHPEQWPHRGRLMLKRGESGTPEFEGAALLDPRQRPPEAPLPYVLIVGVGLVVSRQDAYRMEYASPVSVIADGWKVD